MRIGILGGSFDPVHLGHLAAAEEAVYRFALDHVLLLPARLQPLKEGGPCADDGQRLAMLRLAVAGNPRLAVSTLELERPAPSYTVDTLRALRASLGVSAELYFLLGIDAVNALDRWREPAELPRLARLIVMSRGDVREPDWTTLRAVAPDARERIDLLTVPDIDISSRDLRQRVASGAPIRYQVPEAVWAYIEEQGLYQASTASAAARN